MSVHPRIFLALAQPHSLYELKMMEALVIQKSTHSLTPQSCTETLIAEIQARGHRLTELNLDGKWHAFAWDSSDTKKKGSYRAFETEYGVDLFFKNWKDPALNFSIRASKRTLSAEERELHEKRRKEFEERELQKKMIQWETASIEAARLFSQGELSLNHPYFEKKKIKDPYGCRVRFYANTKTLLVPLHDIDGKLWGVESITEKGDKYGIKKMRKEGCFHLIGKVDITKPVFICEGFATAATLHALTGNCSICAFGSGNLLRVADAFRRKYGEALEIIISGDDDRAGKDGSRKASAFVKGKMLIPKFRSPHPDYKDWNDLKELEGEGTVKNQIENYKIESRNAHTFKQDWMHEYLEEKEITYQYSGKVLVSDEKIGHDVFIAQMYLEAEAAGVNLPKRTLDAFVTVWIHARKKAEWDRVVNLITPYQPTAIVEVQTFLKAVTGREDPNDLNVILHFLWQTKRKALKLPVSHHMMPVFIGRTGAGKSEAIKKLIAPLSPLSCTNKLSVCADSRETRLFQDCLVINMDEMENAEKTDLQALKRTITSEELTHRLLGTNFHETIDNRATLIGSSNEPLDYLIKDPTSIRRFFSIDTLPFNELKGSWEVLNRLDYLKLWGAVDVREPSPIHQVLGHIQVRQEDMRHRTDVEQWTEEMELSIDPLGFVSNAELMRSYMKFCNTLENKYPKSMESIARELIRLGFRRRTMANKRGFHAKFASDFATDRPSY